ncbi:unnamed protein product [Rhizoctonia solani]|uniref:aldehyde dehydrogenase (NAD(+)) n=1 Tax=Rhizoctonia solani TaxID=456999 RepID=A0A8H3BJP0_9AGAM|nr:unnamed protein product [Rhizoctonia solani]
MRRVFGLYNCRFSRGRASTALFRRPLYSLQHPVPSISDRGNFKNLLSTMANSSLSTSVSLPSGKTLIPTGLFINNEFVASVTGDTIVTVNPSTEETICTVQAASAKDVDLAVQAARKAFNTTWGKHVSGTQRGTLLYKLADLIERDAQVLAELEALDNGKPVAVARDGDIVDSVGCLRYYAGWADKNHGQTIEVNDDTKMAYTRHEPIGVCGQMFPAGVLNCVPSLGSVGGAALSEHPDVDKIAFTGSTVTGRKIMAAAAASNLKKVTLELGGKSPNIVFPSADLQQAANWASLGIFFNQGQDCTAGSRVYVHSSIYEEFLGLMAKNAAEFEKVTGDGFKEGVSGGPIVSQTQRDKVWSYIEKGKSEGARVVTGGQKWEGKGYFVRPTIFADTTQNMKIVQEEIFGPVLCVSKFETEEEVIALANDTTYGLGAGLHSNDANQIHRVVNALNAGTVWVNQYNILHNNVPFGGYKQSGIGRELGSYALKEYTNIKAWAEMSSTPVDERQALLSKTNTVVSVQEYGTASSSGASTPSVIKPSTINNPSRADLIWILGGLWSAVFLGALDTTIVATLVSPIGSYFEKSHQASYLGTSYLLSVCCFTPLYGRLSDIMGRKGAMLLALSLFGTGTLLCGMANSMEFLIFARAIAGMGGGGVMTVSSISVTDIIPLKQRGLYQGLANILFGLGSGIGGPVGGWINDTLGWRAAFLIQIPILILSAIVITFKVNIKLPETKQTARQKLARIDYAGSFTLVVCVGSLLLGLSLKTSEDLEWSSLTVTGLLCLSAVFAVAFVSVEAKWAPEPVMPLRLLTMRTPLFVALSNFCVSCNAFAMLYNVPLYFSAVRMNSASESGKYLETRGHSLRANAQPNSYVGLHLLPNAMAVSCGSVFAGWMMRKTGKLYWLTLSSAIGVLLSASLISFWNESTHKLHLWLDIIFGGFGMSSLITSTLIALIASVDKKDYAVATGISYLFRTTGQVLGIIQSIRHSTAIIPTLEPSLREVAVQSYQRALTAVFTCQVVLAFLLLLCCTPIEENPLPGSHEEQEQQERLRRERNGRVSA